MEIVLRKFFKVLPDLVAFNVFVVKKGHQCLLLIHKRFPDYNELRGCTRG